MSYKIKFKNVLNDVVKDAIVGIGAAEIWDITEEILNSPIAPTEFGTNLYYEMPVEIDLDGVTGLMVDKTINEDNTYTIHIDNTLSLHETFNVGSIYQTENISIVANVDDGSIVAMRFCFTDYNSNLYNYTSIFSPTALSAFNSFVQPVNYNKPLVDETDYGEFKFSNNQWADVAGVYPVPGGDVSESYPGRFRSESALRTALTTNMLIFGDSLINFDGSGYNWGEDKDITLSNGNTIRIHTGDDGDNARIQLIKNGEIIEEQIISQFLGHGVLVYGDKDYYLYLEPYTTGGSQNYTLGIFSIRFNDGGFYIADNWTANRSAVFSSQASSDFLEDANLYNPEQTMDDDTSTTDPGEGVGGTEGRDFKDTSDPIDFGTVPTFSVLDSGFVSLYNPTEAQIQVIAGIATGDASFVTEMLARSSGLIDSIISIHTVPVPVTTEETAVTVKMFGIPLISGGGITGVAKKVNNQYVTLDCGTVDVEEWFGSVLDYAPNTKLQIYLPFCGTHQLDVNDFMSKRIWVVYKVDVLTGLCVAMVSDETSVKYTFQGNCAMTFPITSRNWVDAVTGAATGVLSATANAMSGNVVSAVSGAMATVSNFAPTISHGGGTSMSGGYLMNRYPYLILERPNRCLPVDYSQFSGRPAFVTKKVSDCSGYVEFEQIHCDGITATSEEIQQIESLLKGGVLI